MKCLSCGRKMPNMTSLLAERMGQRIGSDHVVFCSKECNAKFVYDHRERDLERRAKEIMRKLAPQNPNA